MSDEPSHALTIGAFARAAGVNVETIRFYQRKGLLAEPQRPLGGVRKYGANDVDRVRFIKSAQSLGFSLQEVAQLLALEDGTHCREAASMAVLRLADVRAKLDDLSRIESVLTTLLKQCRSTRGSVSCPLIASLQRSQPPATL